MLIDSIRATPWSFVAAMTSILTMLGAGGIFAWRAWRRHLARKWADGVVLELTKPAADPLELQIWKIDPNERWMAELAVEFGRLAWRNGAQDELGLPSVERSNTLPFNAWRA